MQSGSSVQFNTVHGTVEQTAQVRVGYMHKLTNTRALGGKRWFNSTWMKSVVMLMYIVKFDCI